MNRQSGSEMMTRLCDPLVVQNAIVRHRIKQTARSYFCSRDFIEVDTPILGSPVDEYTTNHFVVRSRGASYALPQSPQLYKQMVVINAFARYFQFSHCFRDEDYDSNRTDQAPEFMQIDFELRTKSAATVRSVAEKLILAICVELSIPCSTPFPVIDAIECVRKYGTDKPDMRLSRDEYAFLWVINFPLIKVLPDGIIKPMHHPFAQPILKNTEDLPEDLSEIRTASYDLVLNGMEIGGGDQRIHSERLQREIIKRFGLNEVQFAPLLEALRSKKETPHGGMAIGLDRLVMQLTNTKSIKDVNLF